MSFYNSILNFFILPIGDTLFGGLYLKYIKQWKEFDAKTEEELQHIQTKNLGDILQYANKYVSHYKSIAFDATKSPEENLKVFPVLTKTILRNDIDDLISTEYSKSQLDQNHSSGSSGEQSFTYMTHDHKFYLRALQTHWWRWSGYTIGDNLVQFGISHKRGLTKRLKDFFYRCTYVKAFGLSPTELKNVSTIVVNKKDVFIAGYPSVVNQLALSSIKNNLQAPVEGIVCFGDKLFAHYKKNIKAAFGDTCNIIDTYGCAEGLLMACKYDLEYYYIMSPHVYIEIVDDDFNPQEDGQMGHVLVTCLTNLALPIIRYKLGDLAIKLPRSDYPDKRLLNYPLLQKVVGRETDIIKTTKGVTLNVHSFTGVLEYFQGIKQYKVIQNELESITIQYIVDQSHDFNTRTLEAIKEQLNTLTQHSLDINFEEVKFIQPSASGKPQIIESNLKQA